MNITVAEARLLKNAIANKLHTLLRERHSVAFIEYEKGEEYTPHPRTLEEVRKDIEKARQHYREVKEALAISNLKTLIDWKGEKITVTSALELVKQLRDEANSLLSLGSSHRVERISRSVYDSSSIYKKALFDPQEIKKEGEAILKEANRLSILIDKANFNAVVSLDFVDDYQ